MARKWNYGKERMEGSTNFNRYKPAAKTVDIVRIVSKEGSFFDQHRVQDSENNWRYANCPGKKKCALCKTPVSDTPKERAAVALYHISRKPLGKKAQTEKIGQVLPWSFADKIQNELEDLMEEEGPLTKYNLKIKCRTTRDAQFQDVSITKTTKPKLTTEDKQTIKQSKWKEILAAHIQPSKSDYLKKLAKAQTGDSFDEDDDNDDDIKDEDLDIDEDDDGEDEEFDELLDEIEDEDDDEDEDDE